MQQVQYEFGDFRLCVRSRELKKGTEVIPLSASAFDCLSYLVTHRDRPVGRDELIAAVWGRADVSDGLLAQIIVRLRRVMGDSNSVQIYIRTVPRVGYRWVAETKLEVIADSEGDSRGDPIPDGLSVPTPKPSPLIEPPIRRNLTAFMAGLAIIGLAVLAAFIIHGTKSPFTHATKENRFLMLVLPANVSAPPQWDWLQLGVMALVSERVRASSIPVISNSNVVALLHDNPGITPQALLEKRELSAASIVSPVISFAHGTWSVRLVIDRATGVRDQVVASGGDVLSAARAATDLMLVRMGASPVVDVGAMTNEAELLYRRINATRLAGHPDVAAKLISEAAESLRKIPLIRFASAMLTCEGNASRDRCKAALQDALAATQGETNAQNLRARILIELGRQNINDDPAQNERFFVAAGNLLKETGDKDYLAFTYLSLSYDAYARWDLAGASEASGRARAAYAELGDAMGLARSDFQQGLIADRRGQLDLSLSKLESAERAFASLGIKSMLPVIWDALASVRSSRLQFLDELAVTERFWPAPGNLPVASRLELYLVRATALLDNGRLTEGRSLLSTMTQDPGLEEMGEVRAYVSVLKAKLAYDQGDMAQAIVESARAMTPALSQADRRQYASVWRLYIRAHRTAGNGGKAAEETSKLAAWAAKAYSTDEWLAVYAGLAMAEQYAAEKRDEEALIAYGDVLTKAEKFGAPDLIVDTAVSYLNLALGLKKADTVLTLSGVLADWSKTDMRAAYAVGLAAQASGYEDLYRQALADSKRLAGERMVSKDSPWTASHR